MDDYVIQVYRDGDQWCALLGDDFAEGYAGFGDSVSDALKDLANHLEGVI